MVPFLIIFTLLNFILFFLSFIYLIIFIVNLIRKNRERVKKSRMMLIIFSLGFLILTSLDIYLIVSYIYKNRNVILDKTVEKTSEIFSDSLAQTASNFEKNWDSTLLKKFEKLDISVIKSDYEIENGNKVYTIDLLFINSNPDNSKIYLHDLLNNNYLVSCNNDDIVYIIKNETYETDKMPVGKTKGSFSVSIPKNENLAYIRFIHKKIQIIEN